MVELRNISGSDAVDVFPYLRNTENTFVNTDLSTELGSYNSSYVKSLILTNTSASVNATVALSAFYSTEDSDAVRSDVEYFLLNKVVLPVGTSLILEESELSVFDIQKYGLRVKLDASDQSVTVLYKIENYNK